MLSTFCVGTILIIISGTVNTVFRLPYAQRWFKGEYTLGLGDTFDTHNYLLVAQNGSSWCVSYKARHMSLEHSLT